MTPQTIEIRHRFFSELEELQPIHDMLAQPPYKNSVVENETQLAMVLDYIEMIQSGFNIDKLNKNQQALYKMIISLRNSLQFAAFNDWGNSMWQHSLAVIAYNIAKGEIVYRTY